MTACADQLPYLTFGERRRPLSSRHPLLQEILFNEPTPGNVMQETFERTGMSGQVRPGLFWKIGGQVVLSPQVIVEASDGSQDVIDAAVCAGLSHGFDWEDFERPVGILEPEDKASQVVQRHCRVFELLLREVFEKQLEPVSVRA